MNASVLFLFLVVAGVTTLVAATTAAPQQATTPKATVHTTAERPTTVPKTTHSHPTTAPKTTHSQPTTAPKTTHSRPTTAPNTTHSHPTTVPKTTTHVPMTATHHTPGNATKSPAHTTYHTPAGNTTSISTGSTVGTTTPMHTSTPIHEPENIIPSYQFKNGSEVCMLFVFNATLKIKYDTTSGKTDVATIPIGVKSNGMATNWTTVSSCEKIAPRYFDVQAVPNSNATAYVSLQFRFLLSGPNYTLGIIAAYWRYTEPFFPRDTVNYGTLDSGDFEDVYTGTMGKTFGCQTLKIAEYRYPLTIILDHVMLQPFADLANGTFGDVEECINPTTMEPTTMEPTMKPTTANATMATTAFPTKPSPNNGGMIAGIVIGVLAFIAIIVGIAVFVVRKRRMKEAAYGHLDEEHKDYVH